MSFPKNAPFSSSESIGRYSKYKLHEVEEVKPSREKKEALVESIRNGTDKGHSVTWYKPAEYYIVPTDDAIFQSVPKNAFEYYPDILMDFIDMAKKISFEIEEDSAKTILRFCNKYGLLNISGFYLSTYGDADFVDHDGDSWGNIPYSWGLLTEPGIESLEMDINLEMGAVVDLNVFAENFLPKSWSGYNKFLPRKKDTGRIQYVSGGLGEKLLYNYYCESIYYAKKEILNLYSKFEEWFAFDLGNANPEDEAEKLSEYLMTNPIQVSIDYERGWKYKWVYKSLIDALNIMFLNNIIESTSTIRLCENCNAAFIAGKKNQRYCNSYCNDAARSRRYYHKKKNQKD